MKKRKQYAIKKGAEYLQDIAKNETGTALRFSLDESDYTAPYSLIWGSEPVYYPDLLLLGYLKAIFDGLAGSKGTSEVIQIIPKETAK